VYPERYQQRYGYWRPVIRSSIDKFLRCGDLKEGFARVKCKRLRGRVLRRVLLQTTLVLPSCDQKRALLLGHRLKEEVAGRGSASPMGFLPYQSGCGFTFATTGNCLARLCRAAYDTVCDVTRWKSTVTAVFPPWIGAVQTFGDLIHWHRIYTQLCPRACSRTLDTSCIFPTYGVTERRTSGRKRFSICFLTPVRSIRMLRQTCEAVEAFRVQR